MSVCAVGAVTHRAGAVRRRADIGRQLEAVRRQRVVRLARAAAARAPLTRRALRALRAHRAFGAAFRLPAVHFTQLTKHNHNNAIVNPIMK